MTEFNRRDVLAKAGISAGIGSAVLLLQQGAANAQGAARPVIFANTSVVTVNKVQDGVALAVAGGKVAAIGPTDQLQRQFPNAEIYDGRGKAVLPGLVNCHAHLAETSGRGFNEDFGFPNSAKISTPPQRLLSAEEKTLMVMVGALECIKTGTTSVVEFASGIAPYAAPLAASGLRVVFAESVSDSDSVQGPMSVASLAASKPPAFSAAKREEGMKRIADLYASWHGKENGRISVFPTAALSETSSPELLKAVRAFADAHDLGYTIHLSQSRAEIDYMMRWRNMSPPAFLEQAGFLGPRLFAAHCRYMSDADIALMGRTKSIVSHQAAMAANRGVIPPIPALRAAGAPIANGTDNNTNDMFEVMRIALVTERIRRDDPLPGLRPQPEDMLEDATLGGAHALNQRASIGSLEVGKKADLIVLDTQRAHLVPAGRIVSAWVHNGQPSDIESLMVDGRFLMRDRKVLTLDEAALIAEADRVGKRIWSQIKAGGGIEIPGRGTV